MTDRSEACKRSWATRRRIYGPKGHSRAAGYGSDAAYIAMLLDRWLNVHDIRAMGERALEETA